MSSQGSGDDVVDEGDGGGDVPMSECGAVQCKENQHLHSSDCSRRMETKKMESPSGTPKKLEQSMLSNLLGRWTSDAAEAPGNGGKGNSDSPTELEGKNCVVDPAKASGLIPSGIVNFFKTLSGKGQPQDQPEPSEKNAFDKFKHGQGLELKRKMHSPTASAKKRTKALAELSDDADSNPIDATMSRSKPVKVARTEESQSERRFVLCGPEPIQNNPNENLERRFVLCGPVKIQKNTNENLERGFDMGGSDEPCCSSSINRVNTVQDVANHKKCDNKIKSSKPISVSAVNTGGRSRRQVTEDNDEDASDDSDALSRLDGCDSSSPASRDHSRSPSPEIPNGEYEVEEIWDYVKKSKSRGLYHVKWKGYLEEDNTWEPIENLANCEDLLLAFYNMRKDEIDRSGGYVIEGRTKRKLDMPPDPRPYVKRVRDFLNTGNGEPITEQEIQWAIQLVDSGKKFTTWSEPKTDKCMAEARDGKLDESKAAELRKQLIYRHVEDERSAQKKKLKAWAKQLNSVTQSRPIIEVENCVNLELPPVDFEYINDYIATDGIVIPDDPPVGCECVGGCANNRDNCCPTFNGSKIAYRSNKRMLSSYDSYLVYECNKKCLCGPDCNNRVVQDGVTPLKGLKFCIFRTQDCGWGVKTLKPIRKGTFVCMYVGEILTTFEAEQRGEVYDQEGTTYLFDLDFNQTDCPYTVDARYKGNISHFINHSCTPNLAVFGVWVDCLDVNLPKLALFAERDIEKGEEIFFDYKRGSGKATETTAVSDTTRKNGPLIKRLPCMCKSEDCRKYLFM